MKAELKAIGGHLARLAWVAARTFVVAILVSILGGTTLAAASYFALRDYDLVYPILAAVLALVEAVALGVFLGGKQAMVAALTDGLERLRLGGAIVGGLFERMGVPAEGQLEGRMAALSRGLDHIPLAQAESLLSGAVVKITGEAERAGWLRRKIQSWLLAAVQTYTLHRFRQERAERGSVDLIRLRVELEANADQMIAAKLRGGLRLLNWLAVLGLPLVVAVQTWGIAWWAASKQ